jgi:hypothetical protein
VRRHRKRSPGLVAALVGLVGIGVAILGNVITGYIPLSITADKPLWIAAFAAVVAAFVALSVLAGRSAAPEPSPVQAQPPQREPDRGQIVIGEIPREPAGFVDRAMVGRLAEAAESGRAAVVCAVTGLRGVGKTQVAAAYARSRIADQWGLVGWVNAESSDVLLAGLAAVAEAGGVADPDRDPAKSARRLRDYLETRPGPGLLVFDNAVDPDSLRAFLPASGGTQLVVTSTDRAFADWGVPVDVSVFTRPDSVVYLADRTGLDDPAGADAVAAELGDLPLALAQAAAVIRRRHWSYPRYLSEQQKVPVEQLLGRVPGGDYARPVAAALLLSVQDVEDADPSCLTSLVLRVIAVMSPSGISRDMLAGFSQVAGAYAGDVDAALGSCEAGSLLTWSEVGDAVIMHRLVGRVLRERDQVTGRWKDTLETALGLISAGLRSHDILQQSDALYWTYVTANTPVPELDQRLRGGSANRFGE